MEYNFEKGKFTESELENAFIELFRDVEHYEYCNGEDIHRKFKDVLLYDDLENYLKNKYKDITESELESLQGIGPSTAQKIISYRNEKGKFNTIEDIKNVSGIGNSKYNSIKDLITTK